MHTPDERLLVVLTCCARLTDAVEADDQGLFRDMECSVDALNLKRHVLHRIFFDVGGGRRGGSRLARVEWKHNLETGLISQN